MSDLTRRATLKSMAGVATAMSLGPYAACAAETMPAPTQQALAGGELQVYRALPSRFIEARTVSVWLPPGYADAAQAAQRYAVLYMHDGRNVFDPATAMRGETWGVATHVAALMQAGKMRPTIVVGIDHGSYRWQEYVPAAPLRALPAELQQLARDNTPLGGDGAPQSDAYLRFLVDELKPFIDGRYRSAPQREQTVVMGSSMGGLISLYALASHPQVFGAAGCLSTHWPMVTNDRLLYPQVDARVALFAAAYRDWLRRALPAAGAHRLYFDHGTIKLDALYAPFQQQIDVLLEEKGYRRGRDWRSEVFDGADHNEPAWRARLATPLQFLLTS